MIQPKTKIIVVLVAFIIVLLGVLVYYINRKEPSDDLELATTRKQVEYYKDANNKLIAKLEQNQLSEENMKKAVDSLAKALKVKPKFIQGQTVIDTRIDTQFYPKPIPVPYGKDTAYKVVKSDQWVHVEAIAGKDTGSIKLSIRDTISITEVVKNPLIGKTTRDLYIRSANPYNVTTSGYSYRIREKKSILTVGPYIGIDIKGKPSFGIGVQFPIVNVKR